MSDVVVIGLGKLGLCVAASIAGAGQHVQGVDVRADYVNNLRRGIVPFFEPGLEQALEDARSRLSFSSRLDRRAQRAKIYLVCVQTPSDAGTGGFSNKYVADALRGLARLIANRPEYFMVVVVSTVMPRSCEGEFIPMLERITNKRIGADFGFCYSPEFIALGSVMSNFSSPDFVLIGQSDDRAGDMLEKFNRVVRRGAFSCHRTSIINAEISKLAINFFCTMKISFANNLGAICHAIPGASGAAVEKIVGADSRIGLKLLRPGLGFGGPCFPRDNQAYALLARQADVESCLQEAVFAINFAQVRRVVARIMEVVGACEIKNPKVAVLGIAYKVGTYLTEASQAREIALALAQCHEYTLSVYDPLATEPLLPMAESFESCVSGANVVVILNPIAEVLVESWRNLLAPETIVFDVWS